MDVLVDRLLYSERCGDNVSFIRRGHWTSCLVRLPLSGNRATFPWWCLVSVQLTTMIIYILLVLMRWTTRSRQWLPLPFMPTIAFVLLSRQYIDHWSSVRWFCNEDQLNVDSRSASAINLPPLRDHRSVTKYDIRVTKVTLNLKNCALWKAVIASVHRPLQNRVDSLRKRLSRYC